MLLRTAVVIAALSATAGTACAVHLELQSPPLLHSGYAHEWYSDFTLPDGTSGSDDYSSNMSGVGSIHQTEGNSDTFNYGVEGESFLTSDASDTVGARAFSLSKSADSTERFYLDGFSNVFSSEHLGTLNVGTAFNAPQPTPGSWVVSINPEGPETVGMPVLVTCSASLNGFVGGNGVDGSARAEWSVRCAGPAVISDSVSVTEGGTQFNDSHTLTFPMTIGDEFNLEALFSLRANGTSDITGADSFSEYYGIDVTVSVTAFACSADLNSDGAVDTADLGILISEFGTTGTNADINNDGVVDTADLGSLVGVFGQPCVENLE